MFISDHTFSMYDCIPFITWQQGMKYGAPLAQCAHKMAHTLLVEQHKFMLGQFGSESNKKPAWLMLVASLGHNHFTCACVDQW